MVCPSSCVLIHSPDHTTIVNTIAVKEYLSFKTLFRFDGPSIMAPPPYPITEAPAYLSQARQIYQNRPSTASSTTYASAFAVPKSTNDGSPATTNPFTDRSSAHAPSSASLNQDETYEERIQREKREKRKIERQDRLEKERVAREEKAKRDLEAPVAR